MFRRLIQLFQRYADQHAELSLPGFPLHDDTGQLAGYVDRMHLDGRRVTIEGWSTAQTISLLSEGCHASTTPDRLREDVQRVHGGSPRVGFLLEGPCFSDTPILSVENAGRRGLNRVPGLSQRELAAIRRRQIIPFTRDVIRAFPAFISWLRHHNPSARNRIKTILRLNQTAPSGLMRGDLFDAAPPGQTIDSMISIVLPVYNALDLLPEVLERIERHTDVPWRLILVEDNSSDPGVRPFLRDWCAQARARLRNDDRIILIEQPENRGFIASVNRALEIAIACDDHVVLLNSDAFVPQNWASRLLRPIIANTDVASVTPMSNDAEIFGAPVICQPTALNRGEADTLDRHAARFHPETALVEAPTAVGFCMAINIRFLTQVPKLDVRFGRGYGEEVDWCQRVRVLGGRHLGTAQVFVEHRGGVSFGSAEKLQLVQSNNAIITRRYPGYDAEVQKFIRDDPMVTARLALAIAWAAARQPAGQRIPIFLAHSLGGGAEDYLQRRISDLIGADDTAPGAAVILRVGGAHRWRLELHSSVGVVTGLTDDTDLVHRLLEPIAARDVVYSCGVGDHNPVGLPDVLRALAKGPDHRIEVMFHDYFPISPSYTLLNDAGFYAGVPRLNRPEGADRVHQASRPDARVVELAEWRLAWGKLLRAAHEIAVFSNSSRDLVQDVWPDVADAIRLRPHNLLHQVPRIPAPPLNGQRPVIGVLGNIGYQKGAAVLAKLSRELAASGQADLVIIGNLDPAYALQGPAQVHGSYRLSDLPGLVARYRIRCWLIPSIWPETFSYATHEALATDLPVWCFDLGAQAEAVAAALQRGAAGGIIPLKDGQPDPIRVSEMIDSLSAIPAEHEKEGT